MAVVSIRQEEESDFRRVEECVREAFWNQFQEGADEHYLVHKLRKSEAFIPELSLVATVCSETGGTGSEEIVGQICYTRSSVTDAEGRVNEVITFGPLSIAPKYQQLGIGGRLINHSFAIARSMGFRAIVIYGHPFYYRKFGFHNCYKYGITAGDGSFPKALQVFELLPDSLVDIRGIFAESSDFEVDAAELEAFEESFIPKDKFVTESQVLFQEMIKLKHDDPDPVDAVNRSRKRDRITLK